MAKHFSISTQEEALSRGLLKSTTTPRDALPYTEEFTDLKRQFSDAAGRSVSDVDFWQILVHVGKRGLGGPRKRRRPAPKLATEEYLEILRLLPEGTGTRDRLPYTAEFDDIHRQFIRLTRTKLTKHDFWRAVSSLAKRSRKPKPIFEEAPLGGLPRATVEILEFTNPWWRGESPPETQRYRRWAFHEAWRRLDNNLTPAVAVRGPRQVGKSTIQQQVIEQLLLIEDISPSRILRVQFDDVPQLGTLRQPIASIVRWFEKHVLRESINALARQGKPVYLFFDEVQNLKTWASELKSLVDHTAARTMVTGSSSLRIARGEASLAGRVSFIDLGPLRLREIAGVRHLGDLPVMPDCADVTKWTSREVWLDYCNRLGRSAKFLDRAFSWFSRLGGYPVCHKNPNESRSELATLVVDNAVGRTIERDMPVDSAGRAWDRTLLRHVFRQLCRYAGRSVKPQRIGQEINDVYQSNVTHRVVNDAVQYFADSMLIHLVWPLEVALKGQSHGPKICLCDHFVREAWLQESVPIDPGVLRTADQTVATVAGSIIESIIGYYLKGVPELEVAWFPQRRDEPEIDFVLTLGSKRIPIEVKYTRGSPGNSDIAGLESFCAQPKYNAPFGLLVTQEFAGPIGDRVIAIPAPQFLCLV